ncbi:MAG: SulP family inorganic anion transporter [Synoicihabitans sp.]
MTWTGLGCHGHFLLVTDSDQKPDSELPNSTEPPRRKRRWGRILRYWSRGVIRAVSLDWFPGRRFLRKPPKATLAADTKAGLNVALLAFPQSIAYSLIAGLPPQFGLMSSAIGSATGPFFSGSRFIVLGPTNATAILMLTGLAATGLPADQRAAAVPLFVMMVAVFMFLGAILRASLLINYISRTVVTGYITAAAALIFVNQVQNALGFDIGDASTFLGIVTKTITTIPQTHLPELGMAAATLATNWAILRWLPQLPNVATTILIMVGLGFGFEAMGWHLDYLSGFSLGDLGFLRGEFDFDLIGALAAPALALAFVSVLEGTSIGKTLASKSGRRIDVNQEMYAMGLSNAASAVFGGMNSSGSLTRSVLSDSSGAKSPMASVFAGLFVLILMFTIGRGIKYIPTAALAVVVMGIAWSLINRHNIMMALRTTRSDTIVFLVTGGSALLLQIDLAIYLGAFTSIILFLRKAGSPELVEYNFNDDGQLAELQSRSRRTVPGISIMHAEGDLFFGSTDIFDQQIRQIIKDPSLKVIILRLKNARNLDATAAAAISELNGFLKKSGRHLVVSGAGREVTRVLQNAGTIDEIGPENFFREILSNPTLSTRDALKRATEVLGRRDAEVRIFVDQNKKQEQQG